MKINVQLEHGGIKPEKRYSNDESYEIKSPCDFFVGAFQRFTLWTGIYIDLPQGYAGIIRGKARNYKRGLMTDGMVDHGHFTQISLTLINTSRKKIEVFRGDPIAQLVIVPTIEAEFEEVEDDI